MKRISFALASLAAILASASPSSAQSNKPVGIGISGGATIPVGDFGNLYSTGYNGTASLMFRSYGSPLGFRVDGMYNKLNVKNDAFVSDGAGGSIASASIIAGTANIVYNLQGTGITPYLIGGGGVYGLKSHSDGGFDSGTDTKFGINGGIGAAFPLSGFNTFVEARYHHVFTDGGSTQFIPVTFGISF